MSRTVLRKAVPVVVVVAIVAVEAVVGWPSLASAFSQLHAPHWGWVALAVLAELVSMGGYARMQRRLLRSAGTTVHLGRHVALAFAAHSLSVSLPGGPLFSTRYNFQQMRRYGATAGAASWCIALSGVLSSVALVVIGAGSAILAGSGGGWSTLVTYLAVGLALALAVRAMARHPQWLMTVARGLETAVGRVRHRPADGDGRVTGLVRELTAVRIRPLDLAVASYFALANWLLDALCLWLCCRAVGAPDITAAHLILAYCAGMAAASIPLVPGNLGVVDGALIVGLVAGGLTTSSAIAAVVLYRIISLGFIITAGWIVWLLIRRKQRLPTDLTPRPTEPLPSGN
ncbi:lysylphosphatidylglycerol synthase transmembrane domain-containing protein [Cryptosporangium phraense]|uniref:Flippase-like domain-containing protein n=1 Tax=Cryptosporangium phraense TaxID=2593070 RepID=A0A545AMN5_9ACTN|nr:lysylphosphatidylglycerol synthase transmembrane domain-containing protein [Cryptosporangium phraense]TQS42597.1 flippase-like domain-containing protein [Cryptosporangium phraense]